jgi:DNA-binding transcriptional LysR family regulator
MVPADHPLASRSEITWASVADARWLDAPLLVPHMGPGAAQMLDRRVGRTRYDGADPTALGALVACGHGLAMVPSWWTAGAHDVRIVPLTHPALVHRVEVLVLRSQAGEWSRLVADVAVPA